MCCLNVIINWKLVHPHIFYFSTTILLSISLTLHKYCVHVNSYRILVSPLFTNYTFKRNTATITELTKIQSTRYLKKNSHFILPWIFYHSMNRRRSSIRNMILTSLEVSPRRSKIEHFAPVEGRKYLSLTHVYDSVIDILIEPQKLPFADRILFD